MRILEEFWYGNIEPTEYDTSSCKEYKKLLELICRNEEKLKATMTDEQKDLFEKYTDCVREHQTNTDCLIFIAIINQFPAYVESSRNMIEQYNAMCDKVLQSNDDSRKDAVMAYKTILDDLSILLKQDGITPEQQEKITDKMILVADKIADLHEDNRNFLEGIIKYGTPLIGGALLLGAVILGVNVKGTKLPTINGRKWQHSCSQLLCGSVAEDHRDHSLRSDYLPL